MKKIYGILGMFFFFYMTVSAKNFLQPEHGFTFGEIQKINQEIQMLYQDSLKEYMLQYVQGKLKFTSKTCQIRDPQIGCLSFHKHPDAWNLRIDFKTSKILKLQGFNKLTFVRHKGTKRALRLYDSEGRMMRFPFKRGQIQNPIFPIGNSRIRYEKIANIVAEVASLYKESLKEAMREYSGKQWSYPLPRCDKDRVKLGCVSYQKNNQTWLVLAQFNRRTSANFSGFRQLILRHRADGLGELELVDRQRRRLFFPIVNEKLQDIFIPMNIPLPPQKSNPSSQMRSASLR